MTLLPRLAERAVDALPPLPRIAAGNAAGRRVLYWYAARDRRERVLILVGGAFVVGYLCFVGVWQPLSSMRSEALENIAKYEAVTARLTAAGSNLSIVSAPNATLPDATVITDSAAVVGLTIRRLEPEGEQTRIEVGDADFTVLINWLARLETEHSLHVATIEIDRRPLPGIVSARLSVVR